VSRLSGSCRAPSRGEDRDGSSQKTPDNSDVRVSAGPMMRSWQTRRRARASPTRKAIVGDCPGLPTVGREPAVAADAHLARCETDAIYGGRTCIRVGACTRAKRGHRDPRCPLGTARVGVGPRVMTASLLQRQRHRGVRVIGFVPKDWLSRRELDRACDCRLDPSPGRRRPPSVPRWPSGVVVVSLARPEAARAPRRCRRMPTP
jgi:hypothetical protein